ncbi:ethanolamine ammonia-lyase subunit EutC [Methylomonas paludis]|uniref:Ethanolamine ammonia-lyase small subunit n=1 Tax=Methylomonas paludis TaxID=1173101 RepID=A0A975MKY8_9GAMM|nr:ethanolamine ammonia-lyase subunit EutC [Methylomonas paludis]QWF69730.1 ethanolamine ammonia-lyase subunit EutC [Methylomonas paludis]
MKDPWYQLRRYTQARIAQGRAGCSLPTSALLDFQLAHAAARDAVHQAWNRSDFAEQLTRLGLQTLQLETAVSTRIEYLQRPDKGRILQESSRQQLECRPKVAYDVVLILSNGLSSTAVDNHGLDFLQAVLAAFSTSALSLGPICLLNNARVAVADEIGHLLNARLAVIILGERPGLSAADSLGVYLTYQPHPGKTDADRNCISNIRPPEGLSYQVAAAKLLYLSQAALQRGISGVNLKDDMSLDWLK